MKNYIDTSNIKEHKNEQQNITCRTCPDSVQTVTVTWTFLSVDFDPLENSPE